MKSFYSATIRMFDYFGGFFATRYLPRFLEIEYNQERIKRFQRGMLKRLLLHAYDNVRYYHDIFRHLDLNPYYEEPYFLLSKIPVLTKDIVREQYSQLISNQPSRYVTVKTSGSGGVPLKILRDRNADGLGKATFYEGLSWYGFSLGDPIVQLWGRRPIVSRKQSLVQVQNRWSNFYELNAHSMSDKKIAEYIAAIQKIKPKVVYGYASSIELMCKYMKEHKLRGSVPLVVTTAEKLFNYQRDLISSTLALEVYDQYGASEVTSVAFECPSHGCFHVMPKVITNIIDENGEELATKESGRLLLTDLTNFKMPFIKYEIGDLATNVEEKDCCSCGRKLSSIEKIEGRTSEIIVGLNGNRVFGEFFAQVFQSSGFAESFGLKQFQVIQKTKDLLLINLNVALSPSDVTLSYLNEMIQKYLGPVEIHYEFQSNIPSHSSGKRRSTISEINK